MRDYTDYICNIHLYYQGWTHSAYFNILFISNLVTVMMSQRDAVIPLLFCTATPWWCHIVTQLHHETVTTCCCYTTTPYFSYTLFCNAVSLSHRYTVQNYTMTLLQRVVTPLHRDSVTLCCCNTVSMLSGDAVTPWCYYNVSLLHCDAVTP